MSGVQVLTVQQLYTGCGCAQYDAGRFPRKKPIGAGSPANRLSPSRPVRGHPINHRAQASLLLRVFVRLFRDTFLCANKYRYCRLAGWRGAVPGCRNRHARGGGLFPL